MTPQLPSQTGDRSARESSDQCVLYLLGELDAAEKAAFEQRMADSPQLCEELLANAECIAELATPSLPAPNIATPQVPSTLRSAVLVGATALAACLGWFLITVSFPGLGDNDDAMTASREREALLIAKMWADTPAMDADAAAEFDETYLSTRESTATDAESIELEMAIDATPSWMVAALSSDADIFVDGEANDG